ncbi:MAG: HNH endonuclease [Selenomonadaceae bacterium]
MKNKYEVKNDITIIFCRNGFETTVDTSDLEKVKKYKGTWIVNNSNPGKLHYIYGNFQGGMLLLHRYIMGAPKGMSIDHLNHDGLNNCRNNLRIVTHAQNMQNRNVHKNSKSGIRGVYWDKQRKRWVVEIKLNSKKIYKKRFNNILDAENTAKEMRAKLLPYSTVAL